MKKEKPETKICKHCKTEIPYDAKVCPQCRKKQGGKKWIVVLIIVIAIIIGLFACSDSNPSSDVSEDAKAMSEEDYKNACETGVDYKELARNEDDNKGKKVHFTGQIVQVCYEGDYNSTYRVDVTEDEYGFWEDTIYVSFNTDKKARLLEDDIVEIYGESAGLYSYTSVLGSEETIPQINAVYMELSDYKGVSDDTEE